MSSRMVGIWGRTERRVRASARTTKMGRRKVRGAETRAREAVHNETNKSGEIVRRLNHRVVMKTHALLARIPYLRP